MTSASHNVPSLTSLTSLLGKVVRQYESALQVKSVNFYPSKVTILPQDVAGPSRPTTIPWTIRCVPALLDKAKEKHAKSERKNSPKQETGPQQNKDDVFAPPYHSDLLVEELPEHTVLLNKFCVVPRHFLLVTREFQSQTLPPSPDSLAIAYRILCAHRDLAKQVSSTVEKGKELLSFYNCGQTAGASQAHQHVQFAELGGEDEVEATGGDRKARCSIPIEELLERIPRDGKEEEHVHALPLPYQHFVCLLSKADADDAAKLSDYLGMKLLSLLDALFQARRSVKAPDGRTREAQKGSPAWNLLMTTRAMHLIPRKQEEFTSLRNDLTENKDGGVELIGNLSINSLGYAGHLLVKSSEELEALIGYPGGMSKVLTETGVEPVLDEQTAANEDQ